MGLGHGKMYRNPLNLMEEKDWLPAKIFPSTNPLNGGFMGCKIILLEYYIIYIHLS
jgi:hypothetical protein